MERHRDGKGCREVSETGVDHCVSERQLNKKRCRRRKSNVNAEALVNQETGVLDNCVPEMVEEDPTPSKKKPRRKSNKQVLQNQQSRVSETGKECHEDLTSLKKKHRRKSAPPITSSSIVSCSTTPHEKYDVFISFRGEDTRDNFTSHLYAALCRKKIEIFIDNRLIRGDEISPSLLNPIQQSQISVIIFSKGYADSRWCLEELVHILQCKKIYGQIVIPVFYHVNPSDVRHQLGTFADAFAKHKRSGKGRLDKLQIWRNALTETANLSGFDSAGFRTESLLTEEVVKVVLKKLNDMSTCDVNEDLVGIDSKIKEVESLLCLGSTDICSPIGIWGIGGIGKTTIADAVFRKVSSRFEVSYFIQDVRERHEKGELNRMKQELLSTILKDEKLDIGTPYIRSTFTRKRLVSAKVLIVFDDVTDSSQIESLVGGLGFGSGNRMIITTRDKQVLISCKVNEIYEVEKLHDAEALELFCRYAFDQNHPPMAYAELSNSVVRYAKGVPLALKVLSSCLKDMEKQALSIN